MLETGTQREGVLGLQAERIAREDLTVAAGILVIEGGIGIGINAEQLRPLIQAACQCGLEAERSRVARIDRFDLTDVVDDGCLEVLVLIGVDRGITIDEAASS